VLEALEAGGVGVVVLDGEAAPVGGLGLARQIKDEIYRCPPVLVLIGRPQDAWLATWSRAEAAVPHPLDPVAVATAVAGLMRRRLSALPAVS
jgi:DNA-binding response OmpR family regulator